MKRLLTLALLVFASEAAAGQAAQDVKLTAPDGNEVTIDRDDFGVPHITAATEPALFFGQGYAVAQDRLIQMETFWRAATGRLAEIQGPSALQQDQNIRTVYYTPAERQQQFDGMSEPVQQMMSAYVLGINAYIDSTAADPATYLPAEYQIGGFTPEPWDQDKLVAVLQFFMRRFGEIGGDELTRMAELDTQGADWFAANRPVNDPTAPTTIAGGASASPTPWTPRTMADYPDGLAEFAAEASAYVQASRSATNTILSGLGVPLKLGSFAATVAQDFAEGGAAMLLGAPQMGNPSASEKAVTSEVELIGPDGLHVAGMTVPGIPGVIIGRKVDFAWTLTTGFTDNTDTYIETVDATGQQYYYDGAFRPLEGISEVFHVRGATDPVEFSHFRTVHGPVYFLDPGARQVATWKYSFWNKELDMVEAFYSIWKAANIVDFEDAAKRVTMSFNLFYADREQNTAYWHVGLYPDRPDNTDPRLPLMGDGTEEWTGFLPFSAHPFEINPTKGYFANWNNKPATWWDQGDNTPWTGTTPGSMRVYDGVSFLVDHLEGTSPVSFDELQELTRVVRSNPSYQEYPGTYQQVVEFLEGCGGRSENVVPPGQSGFVAVVNGAPVPSPNFADQWAFYQSSTGSGDVMMKGFPFDGACVDTEGGAQSVVVDLAAPSPNPVSGTATLRYAIDAASAVRLSVFDSLGREVAVVVNEEQGAGSHRVSLASHELAAGVYIVRLEAGGSVTTRRIVVAR